MISKIKLALFLAALILFIAACSISDHIPEADPLSNLFEVEHVTIFGHADGLVTAHISGGKRPYFFSWSNGGSDSTLSEIPAGTYYLTVTDAIDQILTDSVTITQPDSLVIILIAHDASQPGQPDGSIEMVISGGVPPYEIQWSNGDTTEDLDGLIPGEYWVRVVDDHHAECRDTVIVGAGENIVIDIDGNVYAIVEIGDQVWMRENLRVQHDPDGNSITSFCYNDNDNDSLAVAYGRLYTWDVAMNGSVAQGAQGICPDGWHIPSDAEWIDLEVFLGMERGIAELENIWRGTDEGAKLRMGGSSGYDARYAGRRSTAGGYSLLELYEYVWTSNEYGDYAWRRCLRSDVNSVGRWNTFPKTYAFSMRCIKDED